MGGMVGGGGESAAEENWRGPFRNGEGLASSKVRERGAREAEVMEVVRVSGREEVAGLHRLFHEAAALLAAADGVLALKSGGSAAHAGGSAYMERGAEVIFWLFIRPTRENSSLIRLPAKKEP